MIFLGDIALPRRIKPKITYLPDCFSAPAIANLEGAIVHNDSHYYTNETKLYNHESVIDFLIQLNVKVVSLGNNHITDIPEAFNNTKKLLRENGIGYCGAGHSIEEARKAAVLKEGGKTYAFLSFGWDIVKCKYVNKHKLGVNPLEKDNLIKSIKKTKNLYPNAKIIILPHWDYELELYPQPMHRELAKNAIDAGADAIFGHHTHCVQGIEFYKKKPIVYGLGNWFIPDGVYFKGKLKFPQISKDQIAIEWNNLDLICHKFLYNSDNQEIKYIESYSIEESSYIKELTPFNGMNQKEYLQWFKKNRRKKKGLPVFSDNDSIYIYSAKKIWVQIRQKIIDILLKLAIKKGPK